MANIARTPKICEQIKETAELHGFLRVGICFILVYFAILIVFRLSLIWDDL